LFDRLRRNITDPAAGCQQIVRILSFYCAIFAFIVTGRVIRPRKRDWRQSTVAPGGDGARRHFREGCLLAWRIRQRAERKPGGECRRDFAKPGPVEGRNAVEQKTHAAAGPTRRLPTWRGFWAGQRRSRGGRQPFCQAQENDVPRNTLVAPGRSEMLPVLENPGAAGANANHRPISE